MVEVEAVWTVLDYTAGALFLLVAVPLLYFGRRSGVHWALAMALFLRGSENLVQGLAAANASSEFLFYLERALEYGTVASFVFVAAVFSAAYGGRTGRRTVIAVAIAGAAYVLYAAIPGWGFSYGGNGRTGAWRDVFDAFDHTLRLGAALWVFDTGLLSSKKTIRRTGTIVGAGMALYSAFEIGGDPLSALCNLESFTECDPKKTAVERVQSWYAGIGALTIFSLWAWNTQRGFRAKRLGMWVLGLAALNLTRHTFNYLTDWHVAAVFDDWFSRGLVFAQPILLVYGMLRFQIMDLNVKMRFTIKQSTLVAIFVGFFVAVTQIAGAWMEDVYGSSVIGVVATGMLFVAFSPLRRFAERLSNAAVPEATAGAEMDKDGRHGLYLEQLEFAWANGNIDVQERVRLERLRTRLKISTDLANKLETKVLSN